MLLTSRALSADDATATALLNCLVREVCAPEQQLWVDGPRLLMRLPRVGVALRTGLARPPAGPTYRITAPFEERRDDGWIEAGWERLADLVAGELELAAGHANPEFLAQVAGSRRTLAALLEARPDVPGGDPYIESEQSLLAGHRFHPSPKARQGDPADWLPYSPETRARFKPHWLAVRADAVVEEGDPRAFARLGAPPLPEHLRAGHALLPAHPWQLALLADLPVYRRAVAAGIVHDLGPCGPEAAPTSSVRTAYLPDADVFCKFSLDVRITNCVRKNAWYELAGAVALDRLLGPVFARFEDCTLLAEPAYRSVALADRRLHEGLGVILREGVRGLPGTPLLSAALADPYGTLLPELPALASADGAQAWWERYVRLVARPVLRAFLDHGVVLEPHLQNVLVTVDGDGMPVRAVFRDLEGTKLTAGRWDLSHLPARVREAVTYDAALGWNRVVYCLMVNHLAEVAAAVADLHPELEDGLWRALGADLAASPHADRPQVRALLAGVPFPAKANLRTRWMRAADRSAAYVPARNPLAARPGACVSRAESR
ncbi:IucA/IucC family protein [Actinomadura parmotrematis]|uniref:IucA/IucC family protein n=1 Tax=Actinomadura parmotrematis TaxID=2864039 RepID=A0ABS7G3U2_9ACTN|nr:IucA/IucC family protein [Actinomadura parmotrematis]MBW8486323.1 IucA/IucC family protein [Actinomadura parmotrematis]